MRIADVRDAEVLAWLGATTFLQTYAGLLPEAAMRVHCLRHHTETAWRAVLSESGAVAWIAEADGAPVGYALLTAPDIPGARAGDAELRRVYVLPSWHGARLGAALMQAVLDQARHDGAGRILLGVFTRNTRALDFYRRFEFAPVDHRVFLVGDLACDDLVLAKTLA